MIWTPALTTYLLPIGNDKLQVELRNYPFKKKRRLLLRSSCHRPDDNRTKSGFTLKECYNSSSSSRQSFSYTPLQEEENLTNLKK